MADGFAQLDAREIGSRDDLELGEHLSQVVVDRAGAEEELGSDLGVREPGCGEAGDVEFLRRELVSRRGVAFAGALTAGAQLAARAVCPWRRRVLLERCQRSA